MNPDLRLAGRALALGFSIVSLAVLAACNDDSDTPADEDPRVNEIRGVAELATYAYAAAGPEGLHDYLAPDVAENCSPEDLDRELEGRPHPEGFVGVENVTFDDGTATVDVVQLLDESEGRVEWWFVSVEEGTWRLESVPGLEECVN